MPQRRSLKSQRGAALAAVLGISLLLGISGGGYLMVVGSAAKDETESYNQDRAFQAAESGLLMGTRWLRALSALPVSTQNDVLGTQTINGMSVTVSVVVRSADSIYVESNASSSDLPYVKRIRWRVTRNTPGSSGTFINGMQPDLGNEVGGGGLNNIILDGPFHANKSIILSRVIQGESEVKFVNGRVTTHNSTSTVNASFNPGNPYNSGDYGQYGNGLINNYDFGVYMHQLRSDQGAELDQVFTESFLHSQERLVLGAAGVPTDTLPASAHEGTGNNRPTDQEVVRRSTLKFNENGTADYYYWSKTGNGDNAVWSLSQRQISSVDGKHIWVGSDVNVLGTVNGKVTVQTPADRSIFVVGDLRYLGFNPDIDDLNNYNNSRNYGIGTAQQNQNVLGLLSGADLYFASHWKDPRDGTNPTSKQILGDGDEKLYVQAIVVAANADRTNMWNTHSNGSVRLDGYGYDLRFIGSRTLDKWFNYTSGGNNANEKIKFYYDTRLSTLTAPGLPDVYAAGNNNSNLLSLTLHDWQEFNVGS